MLRAILPAAVRADERFGDGAGVPLYPEELAAVAGRTPAGKADSAAVRACARAALAELGTAPAPLVPGPDGAPVWPVGVVGSMTHCPHYQGAAVASAGAVASLGIDAEPNAPLPAGVMDLVACAGERAKRWPWQWRGVAADRLLFSAKEAVYKAWYPLTGRWLGFEDVLVELRPGGRFRARLLVAGPVVSGVEVTRFDGRWTCTRGLLATSVVVPA
ncbi:4'-phosphopantetheinyl transferase family protein [Sinomonas sp. RB5]